MLFQFWMLCLVFLSLGFCDLSNADDLIVRPASPTQGSWIPCNDYQICTEYDRSVWKSKRILFDYLQQAKQASAMGSFVEKDSPLVLSIRNRTQLCDDSTIAPFLMNEESDNWPIACVWGAGSSVGTCTPAPSASEFSYISSEEWSEKVKTFRIAIGCSKSQIKESHDIGELYICRDHCLDLGLSYYESLVLSLGCILFMTSMIILN